MELINEAMEQEMMTWPCAVEGILELYEFEYEKALNTVMLNTTKPLVL